MDNTADPSINPPQPATGPVVSTPEPVSLPIQPVTPPHSRKKLIIFGLVGILLLIIIGGAAFAIMSSNKPKSPVVAENIETSPTPTPDPTADWKTYDASFDAFSIKYPGSLELVEDENSSKVFRIFIQNDSFQLVIHPSGVTGESTLEDYKRNAETSGAKNFTSFKISGEEAIKYTIRAKEEDVTEIVTIHNSKAYLITISPSNSGNNLLADQILSTFKFTDSDQAVDTSALKTYVNESYNYSISYPSDWRIVEGEATISRSDDNVKEIHQTTTINNEGKGFSMEIHGGFCCDFGMGEFWKESSFSLNSGKKIIKLSGSKGGVAYKFEEDKILFVVLTKPGNNTDLFDKLMSTFKFNQ